MTLFKPSLQVRKLAVLKGKQYAYFQAFHEGVNVIRGENSSGKSTIMNLLFFGLGGDFAAFNDDALRCDDVLVELLVNGSTTLLLRRAISDKPRQAMDIAFAQLDEDIELAPTAWQRYPFARTKERESFSQVLFRVAGLPEARGEAGSSITMHQLLRMIYADQASQQHKILRTEHYDTALIRQAIGDLFYGAFDDDLYNLVIEFEKRRKEFDGLDAQLKSIYAFLGRADADLSAMALSAEMERWRDEYQRLQKELAEAASAFSVADPTLGKGAEDILTPIAREVERLRLETADLQERRQALLLAIADSDAFVSELEERLASIQESATLQKAHGQFVFSYCPACFAELEQMASKTHCQLCKQPLNPSNTVPVARMANELTIQKRESARLLEIREGELAAIEPQLTALINRLRSASEQYERIKANWTTERDAKVRLLHEKLGYAKRMIEGLEERGSLVSLLTQLQERKAALAAELIRLEEVIESSKHRVSEQRQVAENTVATNLVRLLRADKPRQEEFIKAETATFDFGENRLSVNDSSYFSQSSTVFLNKSFRVAFFQASCQLEFMRFPRLLLLDGIEDGGMELDRAHHFQNLVLDVSDEAKIAHQIIIATSEVSSELNVPAYTTGRVFTHKERSLKG